MKNFFLLLSIMLFFSCNSQGKITLRQMNENLLKDKNSITYRDPKTIKMLTETYKVFRLLGVKSCDIDPDKKYSQIYIEDGFHDEQGFYNGIFIINNKNICEVTTSPYKLHQDSLSYRKVKEKDISYGEMVFYTKKLSIEDFKTKYHDEYFRYELVRQNKVNAFEKCLAIDQYTPKSIVYARNHYFTGKKIQTYNLPIKYSDIKNGIEELPYFKENKKKEFTECINELNILKIQNSSIKTSSFQ
ncbi:hypothetical protein HNP24_003868 [Chryseobacterium sediminis]|uniref:Lipoprotein n=1 Tax=Chryseobacterium sediminis TaxID=1679494 RepID=A0ABR6Q4L5_9FLAO|nr:hypothetical protein [Chryseobacterium sediminis]MBB6332865.1 hypothetical protein [Chryseobacterium sediminis]